jgi:Tol biopolymer transport system component
MFATVALAAASGLAVLAISMSESGRAAFPGANGRVAYSYGDGYSGSIWSVDANGASPLRLTNGSNDYAPSYSANGGRVAFERENGIAVMNADGTGQTQLLSGNYSSSSEPPEWQSDFQNPEEPSETIPFVKIQTFTEAWHIFSGPSFSPDGTQLVLSEGSGEFIYTLTCAVEEEEDSECLSGYQEGHYFYDEECIDCESHIITVSSSSGAQIAEVVPSSNSHQDYEPTFSPGGTIAFSRWDYSSEKTSIYVVSSPGAAPVKLSSGPYDYGPDFSPDGTRVAFVRDGDEVGIVGAGGGPPTVLLIPNPVGIKYSYLESVAFSPDGSKLVLARTLNPTAGKSERGIYTMGVDGSGLAKIVDGSGPDWQPTALPAPQSAPIPFKGKSAKGKVKLSKSGKGAIGTIVCGSSPCALKVVSAKLTAGKKTCAVKVKLPKRLAPGKGARVRVKVAGRCLAVLKKAGKGSLVVRVRVSDALGSRVLTLKSTLTAGATEKHGKK